MSAVSRPQAREPSSPPPPPKTGHAGEGPAAPAELAPVDEIVRRIGKRREDLVAILQALQEHYRYLPPEALRRVCEISGIRPAEIAGVSTFYKNFRHRPAGRHVIRVCHGTACHVQGARAISDSFRKELGLQEGEDTDAEGRFTLEEVACLGCCTLAPVLEVDNLTHGNLTIGQVPSILKEVQARQKRRAVPGREAPLPTVEDGAEIRIALDSCCIARGSDAVYQALREAAARVGAPVRIKSVGCVGMSCRSPLVEVLQPGRPSALYAQVRAEDAESIVRRHFRPRGLLRRARLALSHTLDLLLTDEAWEPLSRQALDARDPPVAAFLDPQRRLATEHGGVMDPLDLAEYRRHQGFQALEKVLKERAPEQLIRTLRESALRGRGGAGFPTGAKWAKVREARRTPKYVICNGDEGDPGAFMDRMILESYPFRVIEGLAIAARAVGAGEGIFYIRAEYPLAVRRIEEALRRCEEAGLLGDDILGSGFGLRLRVVRGAGAFVCGEETALMASIEGRRGIPRLRPPYPSEEGLWGCPTLINNVETLALVPWILREGAGAFAALGTESSKGTKVFALAGKAVRGGLIEVPMGVTIRQIVEEIGGGIAGGRRFKAVQIGGPSGGCVPARLADTPVDYEALKGLGAIMGSGGLVVLDEDDCMVDMARYFLRFTQNESCGHCTFCRIGTRRMLDVLERICAGRGKKADLDELESLGRAVQAGSLCGLGKTAPNPVLSTLKYFRAEYEAHLEGRCPAGRCTELIRYEVEEHCIGCTLCAQHCPSDAIPMTPYRRHVIETEKCTHCDACRQVCPAGAVNVR